MAMALPRPKERYLRDPPSWTSFPRLARRRIRSLRVLSIARYRVRQKLTLLWFYLLGLTSILLNAGCSETITLVADRDKGRLRKAHFATRTRSQPSDENARYSYSRRPSRRVGLLSDRLWTLSGLRLLCHCKPGQACHGDVIIKKFRDRYPSAYDRSVSSINSSVSSPELHGGSQGRATQRSRIVVR